MSNFTCGHCGENYTTANAAIHCADHCRRRTWPLPPAGVPFPKIEMIEPPQEYTGGSVSYYKVEITTPTSGGDAYTAECNDIIEALGMNYAEGNAFKAIWRRCAARQGRGKAGYKDGLYDAEKVVFFGQRLIEQEKAK